MSEPKQGSAPTRAVPTLTEVLHLQHEVAAEVVGSAVSTIVTLLPSPAAGAERTSSLPLDLDLDELGGVDASAVATDGAAPVEPTRPAIDDGRELVERVLVDVQRRVDLMLEYRLREALTPALARMTDNFIRDTRNELAATLREIVARAVDAELSREQGARRRTE